MQSITTTNLKIENPSNAMERLVQTLVATIERLTQRN